MLRDQPHIYADIFSTMALIRLIKNKLIKRKCEVLFLNGPLCFINNIMIWFQLNVQSRYQMQLKNQNVLGHIWAVNLKPEVA